MSAASDLIIESEDGLYCPAGDFHIDPWRPVRRAIITHAHSDHARPGSNQYLCAAPGLGLLRERLGRETAVEGLRYGQPLRLGEVNVCLTPAGHLLGSAQVRVQHVRGGPAWVFSGDYKLHADPTCDPFEPVSCDVFLTESTFGLPIYRWPDPAEVAEQINAWWRTNQYVQRTSLLLTYALGKAQRVLATLDASIGPIGMHGAAVNLTEVYRRAGIQLPPTMHANADSAAQLKGKGIIIAPPSVLRTRWMRRFIGPEGIRTAFISGWMTVRGRRRWQSVDRGFVLSDHADWDGLNNAVRATGATRIGVTHGYAEQFSRWLGEQGWHAFVIRTRFTGERRDPEQSQSEASA